MADVTQPAGPMGPDRPSPTEDEPRSHGDDQAWTPRSTPAAQPPGARLRPARGLSMGPRLLGAVAALLAAVLLAWAFGRDGTHAATAANVTGNAAAEGVTVTGTGQVSGTPDVLRVDFGVEARGSTVSSALNAANAALKKMRDTLRSAGVDSKDLRSAGMQIWPQYTNDGRDVVGYQVSQQLSASLRDLGKAGSVISDTVEAGGNAARVQGLGFDLEKDSDLLNQARRAAIADAKARAELYADAAGRSLDRVVRISEQATSTPPMYAAMDEAAAREGGAVQIEPGQQKITVNVTVEYAFR